MRLRLRLRRALREAFVTTSCRLDVNDSHHRDHIVRFVHKFVEAGNSCRLPDLCGALVTEFVRALQQRTTKGSSSEGSVTRFAVSVCRAFFGELT